MEHTSGFRPPNRDVTRARAAKRATHDHASRNYQRHLDDRFKARELERRPEKPDAAPHPDQPSDAGSTT